MITFDFMVPCEVVPDIQHKQWLKSVIRKEGLVPGDISYLFCDDAYLLEQNITFLHHDTFTDIITFDYSEGKTINGDLYISLDTIFTNADKFGRPYDEELHRVIIHGILHLCGINDKGPGEREIMEAAEEKALSLL